MAKTEQTGRSWQRVAQWGIYICSFLGIICSALVLFPETQVRIIRLAELYLIHRKVNFYAQWMHTLSAWARGCISIIVIFDFFVITKTGKTLFREITKELKDVLSKINFRLFVKPFLFVSGVYLFGYTSIIRADFSYIDDLARAVEGYHGWNGWSRHLADILSTFIHADPNLTDISPLPQMLAALIIGAGTVLLVYILCDGKFPFAALLAGVSLGLSPYFLENISYKFDAPYMALSIFFSIFPFLFTNSKKAFVFSSIVSLLIMCMTYQASSGIYMLLTMLFCYQDWAYGRKTIGELLARAAPAVGSFCFAMIFFRLAFMAPGSGSGLSTEMLPLARLVPGILFNWKKYIIAMHNDFGIIWKIIIMLICVLFAAQTTGRSVRKKSIALIVSLVFIAASFFMSYGVYFLLESPSYAPRALIGFGVFIAIIGICIVSGRAKNRAAMPSVLVLNWCFLVFAFSYGNALADQKRYTNFRVELLLHDLSSLFPGRDKSNMPVAIENMIDFGPVTENISKQYPVIKRLVPSNTHYHVYVYLSEYFHWGRGSSDTAAPPDMPVLLDSYYHTIRSNGEHIRVTFKN
jgi:hypothetical protein